MPPFMSPDFNRQYYNPRIRYTPPIKCRRHVLSGDDSGDNGWTGHERRFRQSRTDLLGTAVPPSTW
jgi:hypothetical protein